MQFSTEDKIVRDQLIRKHRMDHVKKNCSPTSDGSEKELGSTLNTSAVLASVNALVEKSRSSQNSIEALNYASAAEKLAGLPIIVEMYSEL